MPMERARICSFVQGGMGGEVPESCENHLHQATHDDVSDQMISNVAWLQAPKTSQGSVNCLTRGGLC